MAKVHAIHANGSLPKPTLWHKMHRYFTLVKDEITPRYRDLRGLRAANVSAPPPILASRQLLEAVQGCRSREEEFLLGTFHPEPQSRQREATGCVLAMQSSCFAHLHLFLSSFLTVSGSRIRDSSHFS